MDKQEVMEKRAGKRDWGAVDSLVADASSKFEEGKTDFEKSIKQLIKRLRGLI